MEKYVMWILILISLKDLLRLDKVIFKVMKKRGVLNSDKSK